VVVFLLPAFSPLAAPLAEEKFTEIDGGNRIGCAAAGAGRFGAAPPFSEGSILINPESVSNGSTFRFSVCGWSLRPASPVRIAAGPFA
jgi:hypothetical protein